MRRSTESAGARQEQMCIAGGSPSLLCGGLEGARLRPRPKAQQRVCADIRLEVMGLGPASSGVAWRGDACTAWTDRCRAHGNRDRSFAKTKRRNFEEGFEPRTKLGRAAQSWPLTAAFPTTTSPAPFRNQHAVAFLRLLVKKCWFASSSKLQESNKSLTRRKGSIPHHAGKKTT